MNEPLERPRQIRKFNPGTFQSDEEVIGQFTVRERELDIALEVLRGNIRSPSCQHVLLVAPRGRGKTMLLARVAAELRTNGELSERLLPVRFMEENQEIFNLTDFWLEALFHLAGEYASRDPDLCRELQDTHAALATEWRDRELEDRARAAVLETADRAGKQLVLMVENLQTLCRDTDTDFGWKLRKVLQSEPQVILLASATSRFKELDDVEHAFFEQFRIIRLEPLDTGECRRLWQMVSCDTVSEREVRPLQILTGGNPRLLVIIGEFARHRSLRQLMEELVKLIDDHTEYFRSHLEGLAKTERRVYLSVIDLWQPSTTGEIAARARMDVRAVSALLGRLVERGAVLVEGSGRKRMYSAAERLYSIYYKLRRERDEATVVRNLIHFMAVFYTEAELDEWSRSPSLEAAQWPAGREGIRRAVVESPHVALIFSGKEWQSIERKSDPVEDFDYEQADQLLSEIRAAYEEERFENVVDLADRFLDSQRIDSLPPPSSIVAQFLNIKGFALDRLGESKTAIAVWDEVIETFIADSATEIQFQVAMALNNKGLALVHDEENEQALATFNAIIDRFGDTDIPSLQNSFAMALLAKGVTHAKLDEFQAEMATYNEVVERFGDTDVPELRTAVAIALTNRGVTHGQLGDVQAAISTCDEVIARFWGSKVPEIRIQLTIALWVKTNVLISEREPSAALDSFRSMCASFVPGHEILTRQLTACVPDLLAAGISEQQLVEVFSSDREKADALLPLVVALRQRAGEDIRAPGEVLEIAADIREQIEAKVGSGGAFTPDTPIA